MLRAPVRIFLVALTSLVHVAWTGDAFADDAAEAPSPASWSLAVDSDAEGVVSYDRVAPKLAAELAQPLAPASAPDERASIRVVYRHAERRLSIRAVDRSGRVLERTVEVSGEPDATTNEAVLLASNLARDEASELLDALTRRPAPAPTPAPPPTSAPPPKASEPAPEPRASEPDPGDVILSASLFFPLATNFGRPEATSHFDLSLIYGRVGHLAGVQIGSGLVHASRGTTGVQLATVTSSARDTEGASIAAAVAYAGGKVHGSQVAVGAAIAGEEVEGFQLSGGVSYTRGRLRGAQVAVGANLAADVAGAQIGAVDIGRDVTGAQIGIVQIGRDVTGAQIGIVNIGRKVKGAQIGIVNVAEEVDGAALGIVSLSRTGISPVVWGSTTSHVNAGFKFATRYVYTVAGLGLGTPEAPIADTKLGVHVGLGTTVPLPARFDVDVDALYTTHDADGDGGGSGTNHTLHLRVLPGYRIAERLRVFVGGGLRVPLAFEKGSHAVSPMAAAGLQF